MKHIKENILEDSQHVYREARIRKERKRLIYVFREKKEEKGEWEITLFNILMVEKPQPGGNSVDMGIICRTMWQCGEQSIGSNQSSFKHHQL